MPGGYPANYWSFGRNLVNGVPVAVAAGALPPHCTLAAAALKQCVIDSATVYNPWTDPKSDPFSNGPTTQVGVQASGGTDRLRFFVSGDHTGETGPYRMPSYEVNRISGIRNGATPAGQEIRPNQLHQTSLRANFSFELAPTATLELASGYQDRDLWTPFDGTFFAGLSNQLFSAPGYLTPTNGTAREFVGDIFGVQQRTTLERFNGTATFNWNPIAALQFTAQGGVDNSNANNSEMQLPGQGTLNGSAWGPTASQGILWNRHQPHELAAVHCDDSRTGHAPSHQLADVDHDDRRPVFQERDLHALRRRLWPRHRRDDADRRSTAPRHDDDDGERDRRRVSRRQQLNYRDKLFGTISARIDENSAFGKRQKTRCIRARTSHM
jgi:hypothetical protein